LPLGGTNVTSPNGWRRVIAKLDASGSLVYAKQVDSSNTIAGFAPTRAGELYLSGEGCYPDFGAGPITKGKSFFCQDFFVAKLDATGKQAWGKAAGNDQFTNDFKGPLVVTPDGGAIVAGMYDLGSAASFPIDLGAGALPSTVGGRGSNVFLVAFDKDGKATWSRGYDGTDVAGDRLRMAVAGDGRIFLAGRRVTDPSDSHTFENQIDRFSPTGALEATTYVKTHTLCGISGFCGSNGTIIGDWVLAGLATTKSGKVLIAAQYGYEVTLGSTVLRADNTDYAQYDAFLAEMSP
jgi:hypothetical protein